MSSNRRLVSLDAAFEGGSFYTGHKREVIANFSSRPYTGVLINLSNEWNRVELREGKFSTAVLRLSASNQFSPWISVANNLQYDSVSRVLRYRWILRPGNDIFFVYEQNWLDDPLGPRTTLDRKASMKIIYTHRF